MEIMKALVIFLSAISVAILYGQYRQNRLNWRLAVYEKRYAVYSATMKFLSSIMVHAEAKYEELQHFLQNTREKEFFFKEDVNNFLSEIYEKAVRLLAIEKNLESSSVRKKQTALADEKASLVLWMKNGLENAKNIFMPYLEIKDK